MCRRERERERSVHEPPLETVMDKEGTIINLALMTSLRRLEYYSGSVMVVKIIVNFSWSLISYVELVFSKSFSRL